MQAEPKKNEAELHADAWERVEHAVDVVSRSAPQPRIKIVTPKIAKVQSKKRRKLT
jgi:hypothetical protein